MEIDDWIKSYKDKVIAGTKESDLFDEITGSLKAGFLRSSYIMSWIGIAENLKNKILQSSNLGDKQAEASFKAIEEAEIKKLSVDKIILEEATKLNLLDTQEQTVLNFLWQQRCLFAHPYNIAPTIDESKYIISQLVTICLSKPLLFKKNYLVELVSDIVNKPYFISEDRDKLESYFANVLSRVTEDLHPFLFKTLLYELGKIVDDESKSNIRFKLRIFLTSILRTTSRQLDDPSWSLEHRAVKYPYTTWYGCVDQIVWTKLPLRIKEILTDYGIGEIDEKKLTIIKSFFLGLITHGVLEKEFQSKYFEKLSKIPFSLAINFYGDSLKAFNRIIDEADSNNFVRQTAFIDYIREDNGQNFISTLISYQQIDIGKRIIYCVKNGSWSAANYLNHGGLSKHISKFPAIGLILGSVIEKSNIFYYKLSGYVTSVKIASNLPSDQQIEIFKIANDELVKMEGKFHYIPENEFQTANQQILELQSEISTLAIDFLDKLKTYRAEVEDLIL